MASLFQIRRGASGSLDNGELYYNTTSQSLQLGNNTNTGVITLAKLNEKNSGSFELTGNLIVSGNTTIVGNLQFGSTSSIDTVTLLSEVSSSMIPYLDNTFDLGFSGSQNKWWKTLYVNTVSASVLSGSFAGVGNLELFSKSVDLRLDDAEWTGSNHETRLDLLDAAMSGSNRLYVSPSGSDTNTGLEPHIPFRTIKAAVESLGSATAGNIKRYTIYVGSGNYTEQNPIAVPPGVAIVGDTLRTVRLTAANPTKDYFHVHDSNYFYGLRFLDLKHPAFAFSFPASTAISTISGGGISTLSVVHSMTGYADGNNQDLGIIIEGPNDSGSIATATANVVGGVITQLNVVNGGTNYSATEKPHISIPAPSAQRPIITTSPYVQNCSSITGPFDTSGNKIYRALPYDYSDIDEQGAGGGIRIDGNLVAATSPLESFVADAFTQVNQGGPGHLVINKGYAQFVSCFTTFCTYGFKTANGGFANISNSVIDFGKYGLISKKYFPTTYNSGSSLETKTSTVNGFIIDENGAGYTGSVANVTISGGTLGTPATAQANVNANGSIDEIILLTSGSGYTSEPIVTIAVPTGPGAIQAYTIANKAKISGISEILINLNQDGLRGVDISSNMILNGANYLITGVQPVSGEPSQRRVTTYPSPPSITTGDGLAFHQLSNISTGGLVMEYVGSGVTYNALPKYGGVPIRTREVNEFVPGKVFYTTVDNIGNLKIGQFFAVNQLTGEVTINANSFNLSGLNAIGPFKRNGVTVGVVLQEVSNNTTLLNSQGLYGEDTVPTQYAVKEYIGVISASFDSRTDKLESTASNHENRIDILELSQSAFDTAIVLDSTNVTILGNLTVQGTQTSLNTTEVFVEDLSLTLASGSVSSIAANGAGIQIAGADVTMSWNHTNQRIELNKDFAATGSISSSTIVGIGNVTLYSSSVNSRLGSLESTGSNFNSKITALESTASALTTFSSSQYKNDSSSFDSRLDLVEITASYLNTTFSTSVNSRLGSLESDSGSQERRINALELTSQSLNQYTASVSTSVGLLQGFSGSQYKNDSSSFNTRISASTLTFNNTTGQTGIDFTQIGTQISAIASGLSSGSDVQFNNITASNNISASNTIYCNTLVATTLVGATLPVLQYTTAGTLGNILIKGDTSKSIHVIDTITFTGITETAGNSSQATGLLMTGSITASTGFSGSSISVGKIIANDITASGNLYVSGTIYAYELHTIIESASVIFSSGSTNFGDQQSDILTITGSLYQTGSTSFSELTGSLFAFSSSLNSRIGTISVGTLSASIYQTDATQSNNITIVSASAWGAFQSASSYSSSLATSISASNFNITNNSSSFSSSLSNTSASLQTSISASNAAATSYSASAATIYAKLGVVNTFTQNQIISGSLSVTGDVTAYATSDERLKDNIELISNPIQKVEQLRGVEFDWKDGMPKAGQHDYGVIAQDVIKVMPELVNQRQDGYYAVDYDKIIGLLIEVVKEQEKRIKDLENKVGS
jgi:hypothetical protein